MGTNVSFKVRSHKPTVQDICIIEHLLRKCPLVKTKASQQVEGKTVHTEMPSLGPDFLNCEFRLSGWWLKARSQLQSSVTNIMNLGKVNRFDKIITRFPCDFQLLTNLASRGGFKQLLVNSENSVKLVLTLAFS